LIKIEGSKQLEQNLRKLSNKYGEKAAKGLVVAGNAVRADAIKSIQQQSAGKVVTRTTAAGNEYKHTVSKPGDAPNTDTGRLVQSVQVEVKDDSVYVGSQLEYAKHLELGTSNMDARPWLYPALLRSKELIKKILRGALNG
jgi:HK97 gp10 family phage protein